MHVPFGAHDEARLVALRFQNRWVVTFGSGARTGRIFEIYFFSMRSYERKETSFIAHC